MIEYNNQFMQNRSVRITTQTHEQVIASSLISEWFLKNHNGDWRSHPFLAVRILQIINASGIPPFAHTEQIPGKKPVLRHYDEVREESSGRLDHANLAVRHANQSA